MYAYVTGQGSPGMVWDSEPEWPANPRRTFLLTFARLYQVDVTGDPLFKPSVTGRSLIRERTRQLGVAQVEQPPARGDRATEVRFPIYYTNTILACNIQTTYPQVFLSHVHS